MPGPVKQNNIANICGGNRGLVIACALLAAAIPAGCADKGVGRAIVSGTVTYQGDPIQQGQIRFLPAQRNELPMSTALIVAGQYKVDRDGGVPAGTYKVSIEAYRVRTGPGRSGFVRGDDSGDPRGTDIPQEQYLPEKFNRATTLEITIAADSGPVVKDFELTD